MTLGSEVAIKLVFTDSTPWRTINISPDLKESKTNKFYKFPLINVLIRAA